MEITNQERLRMENLEEIKPEFVTPLSINGADGPVYLISDNCVDYKVAKVAKFAWCRRGLESMFFRVTRNPSKVQHEYEMCKYLYENGVSVPQPIGVFKLKGFNLRWSNFPVQFRYPAFVMQYIPDFSFNPRYMPEYWDWLKAEEEKVFKLNVIPSDISAANTILSEPDKKLYLVDFSKWRFPHETDKELL